MGAVPWNRTTRFHIVVRLRMSGGIPLRAVLIQCNLGAVPWNRTTRFHIVVRLRMSGGIPLRPILIQSREQLTTFTFIYDSAIALNPPKPQFIMTFLSMTKSLQLKQNG